MAPTLLQKILGGVVGPRGEKVMFTFYWVNSMITYATYYLMIVPVVSSAQSLAFAFSSAMMIIYFLRAHTTCPGLVPTTGRAHEMYLTALELAAEGQVEQASEIGNLCHTCRIARPLRSKHCVMLKRCVSVFDHHCPYVSNTLGAANYFYFIIFMFYGLVAISLALAGWLIYRQRLAFSAAGVVAAFVLCAFHSGAVAVMLADGGGGALKVLAMHAPFAVAFGWHAFENRVLMSSEHTD